MLKQKKDESNQPIGVTPAPETMRAGDVGYRHEEFGPAPEPPRSDEIQESTSGSPTGSTVGAAPPTLRSLFVHYKWRMLATYLLFNAENLLRLAQPFVLGLAINGLLKSSYFGLLVFVAQHLAHMAISTLRQMYDTRVFSAIYTDLATRLVVEQRDYEVGVSRVAARTALSRNYVEFFEQYVPMLIRAGYSVVGALCLLGWYDWTLVPVCLALLVPAVLLNVAYGRKTFELSGGLHDRFEREVDVIRRGETNEVREHFQDSAAWRIRLSDAEAVNFGLMELFVLAAMVACLILYCGNTAARPGDIFAVFRYVLMFIMGLDSLPRLVQQLSRLSDIGLRLHCRPGS